MEPTMDAWAVTRPGPIETGPLERVVRPVPRPRGHEVEIEVLACAVCRTDLHLAEGDLAPRSPGTVPGHEVVGRVVSQGPDAELYAPGDRVGVAWLASTCGVCAYCRRGDENLCSYSTYTGWDRDGGFARRLTADERYVHPLPETLPVTTTAPLLCAGVIGYRALQRAEPPERGVLGLYRFGASAHLTAQVALARGATVHVMTRSREAREPALELGCHSATGAYDPPPEPLSSAILFAPVGDLVPTALRALDRGGTLAVAGIHLTDIPSLDYRRDLFQERSLRGVTANTRKNARAFLDFVAEHPLTVTVTPYPFDAADRALADLAADRVRGAAVLLP
ncbi:zinc-binding alcohol dehydrogenase family protein [Nocardiopsis sp. LDBS1602]|uniref:zinc-binding alcohol dehydrogenase family protein n=1 Tax=Nocardiopsis sp. LDBS1602 TaxID=3109597 RepID=UPI002DBBAB62|nr:zinc-binding alcohol dehydrogenase family protein [Nocardiopsis sp. LDBS1602]MEC3891764.1 zinc-binding alcohol dehydrogenase family protein [Nocardiopsis sp. LDBS1602]